MSRRGEKNKNQNETKKSDKKSVACFLNNLNDRKGFS